MKEYKDSGGLMVLVLGGGGVLVHMKRKNGA